MRRWIFLGVAIALAVFLAGRSRGAGAKATTIARGLPAGALVYMEAPRFGDLIAAWRDSPVRSRFDGSPADESMRRSMLFLRLAERVAALEALAGFELDFDRAAALFGREAGVALYDLGDTRFVLVTRLTDAQLGKTPLEAVKKKLAPRKHAGIGYYVLEKPGAVLAFALVGDRLLLGNDLERFREALVLTAREAKLGGGTPVKSIAEDADYATLLKDAPAEAAVRVFVRTARLRGTHHFDDFWFFNWATDQESPRVAGLRASLLSLSWDGKSAVETRQSLVDDAKLLDGLPEGGDVKACAGLPPGMLVSTGDGVPRIARLLMLSDPRREWSTEEQDAMATAQATDLGVSGRWLEVVQPGRRAIAVRVGDGFDLAGLEKRLAGMLRASLGPGVPLAWSGGAVRVLDVPLISDWRLSLAVRNGLLVVGSDPAAVEGLASVAVDPAAPRCSRLDLTAASARVTQLSRALAGGPLADPTHRELLDGVAPALLASPGISQVTTVTFRNKSVLVEEAHFRW